jgi:hypothetical protein
MSYVVGMINELVKLNMQLRLENEQLREFTATLAKQLEREAGCAACQASRSATDADTQSAAIPSANGDGASLTDEQQRAAAASRVASLLGSLRGAGPPNPLDAVLRELARGGAAAGTASPLAQSRLPGTDLSLEEIQQMQQMQRAGETQALETQRAGETGNAGERPAKLEATPQTDPRALETAEDGNEPPVLPDPVPPADAPAGVPAGDPEVAGGEAGGGVKRKSPEPETDVDSAEADASAKATRTSPEAPGEGARRGRSGKTEV